MGLRQSMRPRHQVLVLKCYPRFQKSTTDIKPNSSELSYLLYYASTRRSKLHKVSDFLEKRTALDVRNRRLGNVQVTLQIVTALIEKCPRDLPLYASSILATISHLLLSGDVNFIEESVPTFTAFCQYHDMATLAADPEHTRLYDKLVKTYASFASQKSPGQGKGRTRSSLESLRYRTAGLRALQGLVASEAFRADIKYLEVVVPAILENLYADKSGYLEVLQRREGASEQYEKDLSLRRRQSMSVHRSSEIQRPTDANETDPAAASVTTADVDRRANEEVGVLALKCLRHIFSPDNRGQLRIATTAALIFTTNHVSHPDNPGGLFAGMRTRTSWATDLFELISRWTPVQDRFIILVTAMEGLISSPIAESDLSRQLTIVNIVSWLLQSSINFIGLSVMDVMVGLIQHTLLLLQLGGKGSSVFPHHQQGSGLQRNYSRENSLATSHTAVWGQSSGPVVIEITKEPSPLRKQLLEDLKNCIGDLATHVYYSDQIGDMITALFARLKPSAPLGSTSSVAAIQDPSKAADAIADSANLQENVMTDGFFSFDTARMLALQAVKQILIVANSQRHDGSNAVGRNRVDISVWEGTQWLLRDSEPTVRKAYVDAFLMWLQLEVDQSKFLQAPDPVRPSKSNISEREQSESVLFAKKVLSNASQKLDEASREQTSFLQLLHLAIYENALAYADSESDILLLHILHVSMLQKLGVNCLRTGLPMMFRLQDEIQYLSDPIAIISLASLVHGFLWAISQCFIFENTALGLEIHGEISRRSSKHMWLETIRMPPVPLAKLADAEKASAASTANVAGSPLDFIRFFRNRHELVSSISKGYSQSTLSPPNSPNTSPRKSFSRPHFRKLSTTSVPLVEKTLSSKIMGQMLEEWTREDCIAAIEREKTRATSLAGSKAGSGSGQSPVDGRVGNASPVPVEVPAKPVLQGPFATRPPHRHLSNRSSQAPFSDSSARSILRVEDLKRVLSGNYAGGLRSSTQADHLIDDTMSDSMVTASISESESSLQQDRNGIGGPALSQRTGASSTHEAQFLTPAATPSELMREADPLAYEIIPQDDDVPPVPMLPASLRAASINSPPLFNSPQDITGNIAGARGAEHESDAAAAAAAAIVDKQSWAQVKPGKADLQSLLISVDTTLKRPSTPLGAPPY